MSTATENTGRWNRRREGSALLVAVMMLVLMGLIGIAALDTMTKDRQVAGFQQRSRLAYYAADAGAARALDILAGEGNLNDLPPLPTTALGDAVIYPYGQPAFAADPTVANPISWTHQWDGIPDGAPLDGSGPRNSIWLIRVQGQTPEGSTANVEVMALHPMTGSKN